MKRGISKVRSGLRRLEPKQTIRRYARGFALVIQGRDLRDQLQAREWEIRALESALARERRKGRRRARGGGGQPVGRVRFGDLRRLSPIRRNFGMAHGRPIDRYYIENFLGRHADDIRGRVLEIHDDSYTKRYGGGRVKGSDVLDVAEDNPQATIVADLTRADHVPSEAFDCIIFTQTLQFIYDMRSAVQTLDRILKPGGTLLATLPGISQISCRACADNYCWAFTKLSARQLFQETFGDENVEVEAYGNVLVATALLHGMVTEELRQKELDHNDPDYEVLITLKAVKPKS